MFRRALDLVLRLLTVRYKPDPVFRDFLSRAQTQETPLAEVTVAVPDAAESHRIFGVPLAKRSLQPVYLRIVNRSTAPLRLHLLSINPNYFTPLEAAGMSHFSIAKRLSAFGLLGWLFFFPLLVILPVKLFTAARANRRMNECFQSLALHLRPIPPEESAEGFVFTPLDAGTKIVRVSLYAAGSALYLAPRIDEAAANVRSIFAALEAQTGTSHPIVDLSFAITVPGIKADYLHRDFATIEHSEAARDCDLATLVERLEAMPPTTTNRRGVGSGDPVNLAVVGEFETILSAFAARWDESETITLATSWKTAKAFLLGSEYRYSPVSPLYLFGRSQDIALQRTRRSINERLHLRLWLTPLRFTSCPVWVGQVSRDIGVRFTAKTWNLTTHRIDPDVDESRDYVFQDLFDSDAVDAAGYVKGVGASDGKSPRRNLTGDPYFTDGKRVAILLAAPKESTLR
jgi:hypothetical protein